MQLKDAESIFNRAVILAFSKKKALFVFPMLVLCGLMIVLCRALAVNASDWVVLSLTFLPIFLSFGILLATGALLVQIYRAELAGEEISLKKIVSKSWQLMVGVSYLALPMLLTYLLLWTILGIFYLFRAIPAVGEAFSVIFSFGPFLLVLGCLLLCVANFFLLFFVTPHAALQKGSKMKLADSAYKRVKENLFSHILLFVLAALPTLFIVGLLTLAAKLTGSAFLISKEALAIALEWFFIMIPFAALMTPAVIFFFNFATESYLYIERTQKAKS